MAFYFRISIHAPAKGATICILFSSNVLLKFQSTLPRRERHWQLHPSHFYVVISIHAPAKGATLFVALFLGSLLDFNPRSREGSDGFTINHTSPVFKFQSTLPRRERRRRSKKTMNVMKDFNPRSREGSDQDQISYPVSNKKFQSTLPRRERHYPRLS